MRFLLVGGLLFIGDRAYQGGRPGGDRVIVVEPSAVEQLRRSFHEQNGAAPSPAEEHALIEEYVDQEILVREALALGLDRNDRLVRDRLVKLAGFLDLVSDTDAGARERAARALHLEHSDPVIRRYLSQLMELGLGGAPPPPDAASLHRQFERDQAQLTAPARRRLTHVFLSRDRHGGALQADATSMLERLQSEHIGPDDVAALGDAFPDGSDPGPASDAELTRRFGAAFAKAVESAPVGAWVGPVPSVYGLHLVWVRGDDPATPPSYDAVRSRLVIELARKASAKRRAERMRTLRARYDVEVVATR